MFTLFCCCSAEQARTETRSGVGVGPKLGIMWYFALLQGFLSSNSLFLPFEKPAILISN